MASILQSLGRWWSERSTRSTIKQLRNRFLKTGSAYALGELLDFHWRTGSLVDVDRRSMRDALWNVPADSGQLSENLLTHLMGSVAAFCVAHPLDMDRVDWEGWLRFAARRSMRIPVETPGMSQALESAHDRRILTDLPDDERRCLLASFRDAVGATVMDALEGNRENWLPLLLSR